MLLEAAGSNTNPYATFTQSLKALRALLKNNAPAPFQLKQAFHRMIYSSAITVLETYLSDAFHQRVINSDVLIERLLLTTPEFKDRKYSLSEVIDWHHETKRKVSEYLVDIVWHNLAKVRAMYLTTLGVEFPKECDPVHHAVSVRHDLVHRNGRMKDGAHHRFSESDIEAVFNEIESFVKAIDERLKAT